MDRKGNASFVKDWFHKAFDEGAFAQWRPISFMGEMYNIFAKVMANRLHKVFHSIIHNAQYRLLTKRDIYIMF